MHRIMALLFMLVPQPTLACDPQAGSTFCADGMMTQPVTIAREDADPDAGADPGIYVEGAVSLDDADTGEL